jgi:3-dehydroquinate synthase
VVGRASDRAAREIPLLGHAIRVEPGLAARAADLIAAAAPAHRYAIVSDDTVAALHLEPLRRAIAARAGTPITVATFPEGEAHKSRETWAAVTDRILADGCGRDTTLIALGGGVVGDLAGFVAATYMRGIPWVQVPTTLLAMVDSSVGGKTGVDVPAGKNLVGAFHQPAAVIVDPRFLATLPLRQRRNGLAEVLKHGIIADARHLADALDLAPALLEGDAANPSIAALIADSIAIKARVVAEDEREGGLRKILNFGHTVGHAVEAGSGFSMLHGEAIAVGMAVEARLAERLGAAEAGTAAAVEGALRAVSLPIGVPRSLAPGALIELMRTDKKARRGRLAFALPARIGAMAGADAGWSIEADDELVLELLRASPDR